MSPRGSVPSGIMKHRHSNVSPRCGRTAFRANHRQYQPPPKPPPSPVFPRFTLLSLTVTKVERWGAVISITWITLWPLCDKIAMEQNSSDQMSCGPPQRTKAAGRQVQGGFFGHKSSLCHTKKGIMSSALFSLHPTNTCNNKQIIGLCVIFTELSLQVAAVFQVFTCLFALWVSWWECCADAGFIFWQRQDNRLINAECLQSLKEEEEKNKQTKTAWLAKNIIWWVCLRIQEGGGYSSSANFWLHSVFHTLK